MTGDVRDRRSWPRIGDMLAAGCIRAVDVVVRYPGLKLSGFSELVVVKENAIEPRVVVPAAVPGRCDTQRMSNKSELPRE